MVRKSLSIIIIFTLVFSWLFIDFNLPDFEIGEYKISLQPKTLNALATTEEFNTAGTFNWQAPSRVYQASVACWGGGGGGGRGKNAGGGGGGGGAYASSTIAVTPGTYYTIYIGAGGTGGSASPSDGTAGENSTFATNTLVAVGGGGGIGGTSAISAGGTGGSAALSTGTTTSSGGDGGGGSTNDGSGGGGGAGGPDGIGGTGGTATTVDGADGGIGDNGSGGGAGAGATSAVLGGNGGTATTTGGGGGGGGYNGTTYGGGNGGFPGGGGGGGEAGGGNGGDGRCQIIYSAIPETKPVASTTAATSVTGTNATLNANISDTGGSNITKRGFAISTSSAILASGVSTTTETGTWSAPGDFNYSTTTLACGNTYYFRAYAVNSLGTSTDGILSFNTSACAATLSQVGYRFYTNTASTGPLNLLTVSQDQDASLTSKDQAFRLRLLIHVEDLALSLSGQSFTLQYAAKGGGTCASPASSYATVTPSTVIAFNDNGTVNDGDMLSASTTDPFHVGDAYVNNQTYEEANDFTNSISAIEIGTDGMWDFSLKDNNAPSGTDYCFRAVKANGVPIDAYSKYPMITTKTNNAPTNDSLDLLSHADGAEMYAGNQYTWQVLVSDTQGCDDVNAVTLELDYAGTPQNITWNRAADTFNSASGYFTVNSTNADSNCNTNQWTLDFKVTMGWNWAAVDDVGVDAQVVSDDLYYATTTTPFLTDTFSVENDLRITSLAYDNTLNPSASLAVTGYLDYEAVTTPDPPEDIADILLDPSWSGTNYTDTDLDADGAFSISLSADSAVGADTFNIGPASYPAGCTAATSSANTVNIDRVQITNITISNHSYNTGTSYWDPNSGSMTATIAASLEFAGTPISAGTSTLVSTTYGESAVSNITINSGTFAAGSAAITLNSAAYGSASANTVYNNLYVSAISDTTNSYGAAFIHGTSIDQDAERPEVGWDDVAPAGGALSWGTITLNSITSSPSGGTDTGGSGLPANKYYMAYDSGTSFASAEANSGWTNTNWSPGSLAANTAYAFILNLIDNVGNQTSNITPSPVYKYTYAYAPTTPGYTNQNTTSMRWTWVSGGSPAQTDYAYGSDTNCTTGTTGNAYWDESSLNPDNAYTRYVCARNGDGIKTASLQIGPYYTAASTPAAPSVSGATLTTLNVNPVSGGNETSMAIYMEEGSDCDGTGGWYIDSGGATTTGAVWLADGVWGAKTVTGLSVATQYTFCAKAKNGNGDETGFGANRSSFTLSVPQEAEFNLDGTIKFDGSVFFQ